MTLKGLENYVYGKEAARIMGMSEATSVWRVIATCGHEYSGPLAVIRVGNMKLVRRDELKAFARWYRTMTRQSAPPPGERDLARRRERLRKAIRAVRDRQQEELYGEYD